MKLKVAGWKETTLLVHSCEFCHIFKNDYVLVHVRTAGSDILGYAYVEITSARFTLTKYTVFSRILVFIHFKLILESSTTSGVYLIQYKTSIMKLLVVLFSQKRSSFKRSFSPKETVFLLYTFNDIASFNFFKFCWFKQSINTLKFKAYASKGFCFCFLLLPNLWKKCTAV